MQDTSFFTHSSKVIITKGDYKGYQGSIVSTLKPSYTIKTQGFLTEYDTSKQLLVENNLVKLFFFEKDNGKHGIVISEDGKYTELSTDTIEDLLANLDISDVHNNVTKDKMDIIKQLSSMVKNIGFYRVKGTTIFKHIQTELPIYMLSSGSNKGRFGLTHQRGVSKKLQHSEVSYDKKTRELLVKKTGQLTRDYTYKQRSYEVLVSALNRKISIIDYKPITDNMLFFMDASLNDGTNIQINKYHDDSNIEVTLQNGRTKLLTLNDIQDFNTGFSFGTQKPVKITDTTDTKDTKETSTESIEPTFEEETIEETIDEEEEGNEDGEQNGTYGDGDREDDYEYTHEEPVMEASYNDTIGANIEDKVFTTKEKTFKLHIEKILKQINLTSVDLNILDTIDILVSRIEERLTPLKIINTSYLKYVIGVIVIHNINYNVNDFLKEMYPKVFTLKDIKEYMSSVQPHVSNIVDIDVDTVKILYKAKKYSDISKLIFFNTIQVVEEVLDIRISVQGFLYIPEYFKLGRSEEDQLEYDSEKFTSVVDVINGDLHDIERPIVWNEHYIGILNQFKEMLLVKIEEVDSKDIKVIYQEMYDNVKRFPYFVRDGDFLPEVYDNVEVLYEAFIEQITLLYNELKEKHDTIVSRREKRRRVNQKKRFRAMPERSESEDEEDVEAVPDTRAYKKEQAIRKMQKMIQDNSVYKASDFKTDRQKKDSTLDSELDDLYKMFD